MGALPHNNNNNNNNNGSYIEPHGRNFIGTQVVHIPDYT